MSYITPSGTSTSYTKASLITMTKTIMDEIDHDAVLNIDSDDTYPVTSIINSVIDECKLDVLRQGSLNMLTVYAKTIERTGNITDITNLEACKVNYPNDLLRFASVVTDKWNGPVTELIPMNSRKVVLQSYEYTRAKNNNPDAASIDGSSIMIFPYFAENSVYPIVTLTYVSSNTDYTQFNSRMAEAICWRCAEKAFSAMSMSTQAQLCASHYADAIK